MIAFRSALRAACLCVVALAGCAGVPAPATRPAAARVQTHVDLARQLAGADLRALLRLCDPQPAQRDPGGPQADARLREWIARPAPPPQQVFDNLYYVGGDWVSAWLVKTSAGYILIDALNHAEEAKALIEDGMARLGLDPREIRYIVVTHGHGDHYGGAAYLAGKYGARVVASEADWTVMLTHPEFSSAVWPAPPARDIAVRDGDRLTLGDTTLTLYETPGHSPGTLSPVFEVRAGAAVHRAILWGGTSFNFGKDLDRLHSYEQATERMRGLAVRLPIDVLISNHSSFDESIPKMRAMREARAGAAHPFVIGTDAVDRALHVMGECARAQEERFRD